MEGALSYTDTNLPSRAYYYKMVAYCVAGSTTTFSKTSSVRTATPKWSSVTLTAKLSGYCNANLNWKAVAEADGYELYRSTSSKSGFVKVADIRGLSYQDAGLVLGPTYYYKLLPYDMVGDQKMTGVFSSVKSVKPKWPSIKVKAKAQNHNAILVSWQGISGANGYEVYAGTSSKGAYLLIADVGATNYGYIDLQAGKAYCFKVRAYVVVGGNRVYGSLSGAVSARAV